MSCCVKIERIANGYEVSFQDPDIQAANSKAMGKPGMAWRDPEVEMAFKTTDEVMSFLGAHLEKLTASESYDSAFAKALKTE